MDLGCIDMGCVEKERSPKSSASKIGKKAKDVTRSSLNSLNKITSQIAKPPRRKTSPINWFPRKKVEPYLKRKIKMLQEVDGMHLTLDETLGDSNPHYSRVLREKIAISEAAEKAMQARKAAMVEASWCRILQAARIGSKEAEEQLSKAELSAAEAFEAARAVGVIMNDIPDSAQNHYKIETIPAKGGSAGYTVSATLESAFAVDKQVAAAVKAAFVKLANCHSISKDEFKELLHKISENPDTDDLSAITSECDSDAASDMEAGSCKDSLKKRPESDKFNIANIVDMMLGRLQCLKEDELASLATIVATSGLSAALAETENSKQHPLSSAVQNSKNPCPKVSRRVSVGGRTAKNSFIAADAEIPSLDKFMVKRLTRLEREVLEAKNARKNEASDGINRTDDTKVKIKDDGTTIPDLGSVLKRHSSKLEKEIEEARMNGRSQRAAPRAKQDVADVPSLDKYLVKRLTRLEMEVQEARNRNRLELTEKMTANIADANSSEEIKENIDLNKIENRNTGNNNFSHEDADDQKCKRKEAATDSEPELSLQREGNEEASSRSAVGHQKLQRKDQENGANYESLDKVLVKHVSRLEKEKSEFCADEKMRRRLKRKDTGRELESTEHSLDQVLVKHMSRLEREKMAAVEQFEQQQQDSTRYSVSRRQAREKELQAAWGGLSLGNSMRPHVSRLQRDKADWLKAEEEERNREATEGEGVNNVQPS
ncbi:hypothetical protein C2S51_011508 [Perilla frutescens var. frutescens]|nr:hypothetical protein C2S51_011508 [Perilla frutescens var. frutescens]